MAEPAGPPAADKGFFASLAPAFPEYTGPYAVGSVDIEVPIQELRVPAPRPHNAAHIETVQFRIFYPCQPGTPGRRIKWLPAPQRHNLAAFFQYLGIPLAQAFSFLPRHLHHTSIQAVKNAPILEAVGPSRRWPTLFFSHGLGGNRNTYSQIVGSLASHGVFVVCPEHRDGSAVATFIRSPSEQRSIFRRIPRKLIPYRPIPHDETVEVHAQRNDQLRIRLWELGLIHEAILAMDNGSGLANLSSTALPLIDFRNQLDVQTPGRIIFAGHSFGATTMVQFMKCVYYLDCPDIESQPDRLYRPNPDSSIRQQITCRSPTILLDMWCFPLLAQPSIGLFNRPLPVYDSHIGAAGGDALLVLESQSFIEWEENIHTTARAISPNPRSDTVRPGIYRQPDGRGLDEPHFFYVRHSAHLNQSDIGLLFPKVMQKVFGAREPERIIRLNVRAILQFLRRNQVLVARTWGGDMVDNSPVASIPVSQGLGDGVGRNGIANDRWILDKRNSGAISAWRFVDMTGMGGMCRAIPRDLGSGQVTTG